MASRRTKPSKPTRLSMKKRIYEVRLPALSPATTDSIAGKPERHKGRNEIPQSAQLKDIQTDNKGLAMVM